MSPAALKRALDPAYIGSPFAQTFQFFDGDVNTPMDLTGRAVTLFLDRYGLPDMKVTVDGVIGSDGRVLFRVADTSEWPKGDYRAELRLDGVSVAVGSLPVAQGAASGGSATIGAAQPPTAPGIVVSASGVVQIVYVAPSASADPASILLPPDLSEALGGAATLADGLAWLAQQIGTPSPVLRALVGDVLISSVATGALTVDAAEQVLLSGAISCVSAATGSPSVGAASDIALVGSAVSMSSLTGAMTLVTQIALAGSAGGASIAAGALTVEAGGVAPMSFPAQGAGYDFDFVTADYRTIAPNTGTQTPNSNANPILYKQMDSQPDHYVTNKDGSLVYMNTWLRRTDRGLFSQTGLQNHMLRPRELTFSNWIKANATATRDQVGRDGVANTACLATFTADNGTFTQTATVTVRNMRAALDAKRVSGTDPLEVSTDSGTTWESFPVLGTGSDWGGWHRLVGAIFSRTNPTMVLRGKAGNAFIVDFVHTVSKYTPNAGSEITDIDPYARFPTATGGLCAKDRIHHTITSTGGGPSGEDGINILRSQATHGFYSEFGYRTSNSLVATVGGLTVNTNAVTPTVGISGIGQMPALVDTAGDGSVMNKLMYFLHDGVLRAALNGTLYSVAYTSLTTATTHDFATNGASSPLGSYVKRLTWFDGSYVPSDEEMIAWTS